MKTSELSWSDEIKLLLYIGAAILNILNIFMDFAWNLHKFLSETKFYFIIWNV